MSEPKTGTFPAEWHSYQGASTVIEARSRAEALEQERRNPFSGAEFDLFEQLENIFVLEPSQQRLVFLFSSPNGDGSADAADEPGPVRKYLVSATYRKIYVGDVVAETREAAERDARANPARVEWTLAKTFEHIVVSPESE